MSFISSASFNSKNRGYDYYQQKKLIQTRKINQHEFEGIALGSNGNRYKVRIDLEHPKKNSHCTCPHASDNRVMCKHKVGLYFTLFPNEAKEYVEDLEEQESEYEEYQEDLYDDIYDIVSRLSKDELETALISLLEDSPEWVCENFVMEYSDNF